MNTWKVHKSNRLLTEIKNQLSESYSTSDIKWSIEHNRCFINYKIERFSSALVKKGDVISIYIEKRPFFYIENQRILFEDPWVLLYNKPPFLTSEELAQLAQCNLVHRLDRDTSGIILLAKQKEAQKHLEDQFRRRNIHKEYFAYVHGTTDKKGIITGNMAPVKKREGAISWGMAQTGLWSQTLWRLLRVQGETSLLQCIPLTGRTHQIRVHLQFIGHPIVGDFTYGYKKHIKGVFRQLLHSGSIRFYHPKTLELLTFSAPLPSDFLSLPIS